MRSIWFILLLGLSAGLKAQTNLIPNPSFENVSDCPDDWQEFDVIEDWWIPENHDGSSDCVQLCQEHYEEDPLGQWGIIPHDGAVMTRIGLWRPTYVYREYIQTELLENLDAGEHYKLSFFATGYWKSRWRGTCLQVHFSSAPISSSTEDFDGVLEVEPTLFNTDTFQVNNWIEIEFEFVANGGEQYITIGNFLSNDESDVEFISFDQPHNSLVVMLDNFSLVHIPCLEIEEPAAICQGETAELSASGESFIGWALASAPDSIISMDSIYTVSPLESTTYSAKSDCNDNLVTVEVLPAPSVYLGPDLHPCMLDSIDYELSYMGPYDSLLWSTGEEELSIDVSAPGEYILTVTDDILCSNSDTVQITPVYCPPYLLTPNVFSPNGDAYNNRFRPKEMEYIISYAMDIYDRWGNLIASDILEWDGAGHAEGVYNYVIRYRDALGDVKQQAGVLELLR